ncbi:SNF1-related protein kinase regulatory subunit beta-1 [Nymphaea thermarum]|nr:SNF1-related protein kinase regulatory subunit beta-1 [Nymphaea thermarum]
MGNANVAEGGGENAAQERGARQDGAGENLPDGLPAGFPPVPGRIARPLSPPQSPRRSRSPMLFAPPTFQVPVPPLDRPSELHCMSNEPGANHAYESMDIPQEPGIPVLITWSFGGNDVAVEGSWDNWTSRKTLMRSGKDHVLLLVLPSGIYHYKFIVDGEWRYIPDLPCISDETGHVNNLLDVQDYVPDCVGNTEEFEPPRSPDSSYDQPSPVMEDFAKEPPLVPPHVHLTVLGMEDAPELPLRPHHVVLNHLFIEKGWGSESLVALGLTHRFQEKYVTVVLYKPLRR